ncbi:MAG: sugar phosphate isomerase/epimerase [Pseudomonadota bacterium]
MRLAISNIAWDVVEDEAMAKLLQRFNIDAIDIAPGKYFPQPNKAREQDIKYVKQWWAEHGIELTGMQSLLFGTSGLNLFGSAKVQNTMLEHLTSVCRIGSGLGATRLVFGSPKNRDRNGFNMQETLDIAAQFFNRLGDIAKSYEVQVCLEPNPPLYGANFMTTSPETARVVELVAHHAIKMQLDTGALTMNTEDVNDVVESHADLIGHIHASEPELLPLGDGGTDHDKIFNSLVRHLPNHLVSIEMVATTDEPHLVSVERALQVATQSYQNDVR